MEFYKLIYKSLTYLLGCNLAIYIEVYSACAYRFCAVYCRTKHSRIVKLCTDLILVINLNTIKPSLKGSRFFIK